MILNEEQVYSSIESYRKTLKLNQTEMAEIMGLKNKSAYSNMVKNKTMKFEYFLNLLHYSNKQPGYFLEEKSRYEQQNREPDAIQEPKVVRYSCPDCIEKQNEINRLNAKLVEIQDKYITLKDLTTEGNLKQQCG